MISSQSLFAGQQSNNSLHGTHRIAAIANHLVEQLRQLAQTALLVCFAP